MLRQNLPDVQSWGKATAKEARPHKTKHSYLGFLNIHLPEQLPVNPCPADTLLEVEELGKEKPG